MYEKDKTLSSILSGVDTALKGGAGANLSEWASRSKTGGFKQQLAKKVFGDKYITDQEYKKSLKNGLTKNKKYIKLKGNLDNIQSQEDTIKAKLKGFKKNRANMDKEEYKKGLINLYKQYKDAKNQRKDIEKKLKTMLKGFKQNAPTERGYTPEELSYLYKLKLAEEGNKNKGKHYTTPRISSHPVLFIDALKKLNIFKPEIDPITNSAKPLEKWETTLSNNLIATANGLGLATFDKNDDMATAQVNSILSGVQKQVNDIQSILKNVEGLPPIKNSSGYDMVEIDGKRARNDKGGNKKTPMDMLHDIFTYEIDKETKRPKLINTYQVVNKNAFGKTTAPPLAYQKVNLVLRAAIRLSNLIKTSPYFDESQKQEILRSLEQSFINHLRKK